MADISIDTSSHDRLAAQVRDSRLPDFETRQRIRRAAGVSLRDAADALGVSPMALHRWERGTSRPTREHAIAYAALLAALEAATR